MPSDPSFERPKARAHRLILPLGMRVLVQILRDEDRTDAGLYLPAGAKEAQDDAAYGKVIEVARDRPTSSDVAEIQRLCDSVLALRHGAVTARLDRTEGLDDKRLHAAIGG